MRLEHGTRRRGESKGRRGHAGLWLLLAVVLAGAAAFLAYPRLTEYRHTRDAQLARDAFGYVAARARAAAVDRGGVVVLMIRPDRDAVLVVSADATDTLEVVDYADGRIRADVVLDERRSAIRLCYVPGGYAHPGCAEGSLLPVRVGFTAHGDTVWSTIGVAGQVER